MIEQILQAIDDGRLSRAEELLDADVVKYVRTDAHDVKQFLVQSRTTPGREYRVSFNGSFATFCTCEDWRQHDMRLAKRGVPFSTHTCLHGCAARLFWAEFSGEYDRWSDAVAARVADYDFQDYQAWANDDGSDYRRWCAERNNGGY